VALIVALALIVPRLVEEPLRRTVERNVNQQLKGYRVTIGELGLQPLALAIQLFDVRIVQEAHPKPAVAELPRFRASVQWRAVLHGKLVGDVLFERPRFHLNLPQLQTEARDEVKIQDRGWQDALEEIYPLKINEFKVEDGSVTYIDRADAAPLEIDRLDLVVNNVRNVWSPERTYPSEIEATARLFGKGELDVTGNADFLAKPYPGMKVALDLKGTPLAKLEPATQHFNASIRGGVLSARGTLEYAPTIKQAHLESASVDGLDADFLLAKAKTGDAEQVVEKVGRSVEQTKREPDFLVQIDRVEARKSTLGIQNRDANPNYRLFVDANELAISDFSNRPGGPRSRLELDGRFMGSGRTRLRASFLPTSKSPDLDINLSIDNTDMKKLNPVWKAHGGFDVAGGWFALYLQLAVRNDRIDGYIKPIFTEIDVYDTKQDSGKGIFQQVYEGIVGGASELLENQPRDTVAMRTDLSGPVSNPHASIGQILFSILENAFIKAIVPGLEKTSGQTRSGLEKTPGHTRSGLEKTSGHTKR